MKKLIIGLVIGVLAGAVAGFGTGIFIYPFWFLNDAATEALPAGVARSAVAQGTFIHANPSDPVHWGRGSVAIYGGEPGGAVVHLQDDFEVGPGPRFHLYLVDSPAVASEADFKAAGMVDLGRLRAFRGSQVFAVPAAVDPSRYRSVVVWCKEFGVLISPAALMGAAPRPG